MEAKSFLIGIDENGFGSRLGPLVITGISAYVPKNYRWLPRIKESKAIFRKDKEKDFFKLARISLGLFYAVFKKNPSSLKEFLNEITEFPRCTEENSICFSYLDSLEWRPPQELIEKEAEYFKEWMKEENIRICKIHSLILCPRDLNRFLEENNKNFIDLLCFISVIKRLLNRDSYVEAGKIGMTKFYYPLLKRAFSEYSINPLKERKESSVYLLTGEVYSFKLSFLLNVEEKSFLACLASLIGKYIREIFMRAILKGLGEKDYISGYWDKKTKDFIDSLKQTLKELR
ncbi:MAG: hypothetical protein N2Z79_00355, partial [Candidatus Omnitrophica bacterium]|nr:hypothetical protein [Candidatus Omnitrophota bacterium]